MLSQTDSCIVIISGSASSLGTKSGSSKIGKSYNCNQINS